MGWFNHPPGIGMHKNPVFFLFEAANVGPLQAVWLPRRSQIVSEWSLWSHHWWTSKRFMGKTLAADFFFGGGGKFPGWCLGIDDDDVFIHVYFVLLSHDDIIVYGLNSNVIREPTNAELWDPWDCPTIMFRPVSTIFWYRLLLTLRIQICPKKGISLITNPGMGLDS